MSDDTNNKESVTPPGDETAPEEEDSALQELPQLPPYDEKELDRIISASMIRLRTRSPFFAALALFARVSYRPYIPTAATDGRDIFWNPWFLKSLKGAEVDGVMLHEVLHAALLHVVRRGPSRDKVLWNIACDVVVNGMIFAEAERNKGNGGGAAFTLPEGHIREQTLEHLSVEEVYEIIQADDKYQHMRDMADAWRDLLEGPGEMGDPSAHRAALEAHWRAAHAQAQTALRASGRGNMPAELARELASLDPAQLDWRSRLWRYLVRTPTDFSGFDRRFIGRGLYLEAMEGETLRVYVGIDTSGSIADKQLAQFLGEVQGILLAYPHIRCYLFYVDAAAYGPYVLNADTDIGAYPKPVGGGGTDFRPYFIAVEKAIDDVADFHSAFGQTETLCVYLTDGYGAFPDPAPSLETLWIVTAGGLDLNDFPFGETVRLV